MDFKSIECAENISKDIDYLQKYVCPANSKISEERDVHYISIVRQSHDDLSVYESIDINKCHNYLKCQDKVIDINSNPYYYVFKYYAIPLLCTENNMTIYTENDCKPIYVNLKSPSPEFECKIENRLEGYKCIKAFGQILIFVNILIVRKNIQNVRTNTRSKQLEFNIARKLAIVALTDFMCWFPVGILGFLSLKGQIFDREVYAWIAVFVMPVNSALNPILYTIPAICQQSVSVCFQNKA
ncbi:G-protein coupled receptor GRL101 [Biomphalaria glabrata]